MSTPDDCNPGAPGDASARAGPARDELAALRAELAQTRARLDDISRLVSDWIWEVDRDLKVTAVSPRVLEALGYHPLEMIGRPIARFVGPDVPLVGAQRGVRPRPFRDHEATVTDKLGAARTFRLSALPMFDPASGRFTGYRGTAQDVTELRAREAALVEAKNAAEEANRVKSEFLANMSHELRTPLNAIIGFSEIMQTERLGPLGTPQYRDYVNDIANSARHLSEVINDVLDVAKLESGKFQLHDEEVDPAQLLARAARIVAPRAKDAEVTLTTEPAGGDAALRIVADGRKLLQVLLNLLSNAVKFTPAGGEVWVSAGPASGSGGYRLCVADTGIGMSAADQEIALAPFGQVDSSLARRYEGTGLGLPLSKALAELHGGALTIDSAPEQGTRVTVTLPAERVRIA